jgi:predicted DNA-binding antitoxin AbrB/MazE fold protein
MSLEVEATYENGVLKLDKPLPLAEYERVTVRVEPHDRGIRQSAGLIPFAGNRDTLEYLLGPDNQPWESA